VVDEAVTSGKEGVELESFVRTAHLAALIAGVGGLGFLWWTKRQTRPSVRLVLKILAVAGLIGAVIPDQRMMWDGRYPTAEFQITFVDENRQPVQGVELRVEDKGGRTYFHYPVTDYLPDRAPTSDHSGLMVFHHAGQGVEFSGEVRYLYCLFPRVVRRGPSYTCRFVRGDTEVYRIDFWQLDHWQGSWDEVAKVRRRWKWPAWPMSELLMTPDESHEHWQERALQFFDLDGDGKLGPEERAAYNAGRSLETWEAALARKNGTAEKEEELELRSSRKQSRCLLRCACPSDDVRQVRHGPRCRGVEQ
jgi:hypothetical protein